MSETWIQLTCPGCGKDWQENPSDLPGPGDGFTCPDCAEQRPMSEFTRTQRDLEIVEQFHGA